MTGTDRFCIADSSTWRELDGQVVILEGSSAVYFAVEGSGGILWKRLAEGATQDQLVAELVGTFDIPSDRAAGDVKEFLDSCQESGLITKVSVP